MEPTIEEQEVLADSRRRIRSRLTGREMLADALVGPGFLLAATVIWSLRPPGAGLDPVVLIVCIAVTVLASRVTFETPFGYTPATQLALVPMLFALPVAVVPFAFLVALFLATVPDVRAGHLARRALLRVPGNSWSAMFPCAVFALAGIAPPDAGPVLLVLALVAQFTGDFAQSCLYFGIARGARIRAQLRDSSWVYAIDAALSGVAVAVAEEMHAAPYAILAVLPLLGLLYMFAHERQGRLNNLLELNETYRGTALLLGDVIAADDGYTGDHSQDVVSLAVAVAGELRLDAERRRNLEFGARLHDVGKIAIPKEILNKPGKLDPHEWEIMKTHAAEGERMLSRVGGFMKEVGQIVRSHHERWDGGGYPDGLAESTIPVEARIITCCDSWNAMRTDRPYRRALSHEAAMAELRACAGSQFDPEIVEALVSVVSAALPAAPAEDVVERRVPAGYSPAAVVAS